MRKILLIFAVLFASCFEVQVKPREVHAQSINTGNITYMYTEKTIYDMTYGIWTGDGGGIRAPAVFVINLTKDALEVELLQAQVDELRRKEKSK